MDGAKRSDGNETILGRLLSTVQFKQLFLQTGLETIKKGVVDDGSLVFRKKLNKLASVRLQHLLWLQPYSV